MEVFMALDRGAFYKEKSIWNRQAYMALFRSKTITSVVRVGDRSDPNHKNYLPPGVPMAIRFLTLLPTKLATPDTRGDLLPDEGLTFERTECIVKKIGDLTEEDLSGCSPDTATPEFVRYHLALINNTELPSWDTVVTIWKFKYLPNVIE
ncbi:TPA: hypothetical protein DCZ81_02910 [Candidatus Collierbacteria bacterium]|nr:hypothetical protein [Candidatus Collierbacteria bacterium]